MVRLGWWTGNGARRREEEGAVNDMEEDIDRQGRLELVIGKLLSYGT